MSDFSPEDLPPSNLFPPGTVIGTYVIESWLTRPTENSFVFVARSLTTQGKFVFKYMRPELGAELIHQEIEMNMTLYRCPNAVMGFDFVQLAGSYGYFMDRYTGGDLLDFICSHTLTEDNVRNMSRRILESLFYMHNAGFVHRDIKPENILLDGEGSEPNTYLADFGFAIRMPEDGSKLTVSLGTKWYMAPELYNGTGYDQAVDMWAFGVTLHAMFTKSMAFPNPRTHYEEFLDAIQHGEYFTKGLEEVSDDACDLIHGLLRPDPAERLTVEQALAHPFYSYI